MLLGEGVGSYIVIKVYGAQATRCRRRRCALRSIRTTVLTMAATLDALLSGVYLRDGAVACRRISPLADIYYSCSLARST